MMLWVIFLSAIEAEVFNKFGFIRGFSYRKANKAGKTTYPSSILLSLKDSSNGPLHRVYPLRLSSFDETYAKAVNVVADHLGVDDMLRVAMHDSVENYKRKYGIACESHTETITQSTYTQNKNPNASAPGFPFFLLRMNSEDFLNKIFKPDGSLLRVNFLPTFESDVSSRPAAVCFAWIDEAGRHLHPAYSAMNRDIKACYGEVIEFICRFHEIEIGSDIHEAMTKTFDHFVAFNGIEKTDHVTRETLWLTTSKEERQGVTYSLSP
jgi:hypothetical protein